MNISKSIKKGILAGVFAAFAGLALLIANNANASTFVGGARDCSVGSIIECGAISTEELVDKYNANETNDLPEIYNAFGISSSEVASLDDKTIVGEVREDNTVWVDGELVGINAMTAGRTETTNSEPISGTDAFKRPQSDLNPNTQTTLHVYIGYEGNNPAPWGIMSSCGNPLTWDTPDVEIQKTIAKEGSTDFSENVTLTDGEKATVKIEVSETTGNAHLNDVKVGDTLPAGMTFVEGSVAIDGVIDASLNPKTIGLGRIEKGTTKTITFDVVANIIDKECGTDEITNTAVVVATMQPQDSDTAGATVSKECEPVFSCKALTATIPETVRPEDVINFALESGDVEHTTVTGYIFKVNGESVQESAESTFAFTVPSAGDFKVTGHIVTEAGTTEEVAACTKTFTAELEIITACSLLSGPLELKTGEEATYTATAEAQNTTVTAYEFFVNGESVQSSASPELNFTPETAGEYELSVEVTFANGDVKTSEDCEKTVIVTETPNPEYRCELLTITPATVKVNQEVTFKVQVVAANGAIFQDATFDFGDGESKTITIDSNNGGTLTTFHKYTTTGTKNIQVSTNFVVDGEVVAVTSEDCAGVVEVEEAPVDKCPYPGKENLPAGSEDCFEPCPYPGLKDIKKSDAKCKPPVLGEKTPELPNTGAGSIAGILVAVTALGAYGHRVLTLKRQ